MKWSVMGLFSLGVVVGGIVAISGSSWFGVWLGLELNLLSFLPLVVGGGSSEAGLKYFLVQASASFVMLSGVSFGEILGISWIAVMALIMKGGGAPLHFWFPLVAEGMEWFQLYILMSIQKFIPLVLLSYLCEWGKGVFILCLMACGVVGALGGINELYTRKLLSFSSINHLGWMFLAMVGGGLVWVVYFFIYCLILLSLVVALKMSQGYHLGNSGWGLGVGLLSLGGLPPLLGFFPKWMVMQGGGGVPLMILIASSVVTLFYYIRLFSGGGGSWWGWLGGVNLGGGSVSAILWTLSLLH